MESVLDSDDMFTLLKPRINKHILGHRLFMHRHVMVRISIYAVHPQHSVNKYNLMSDRF